VSIQVETRATTAGTGSRAPEKILEVRNLHVDYPVFGGVLLRRIAGIRAVEGVSFDVHRGETLGIVGESGCGKSTVGRAIINVLGAMVHGVRVEGEVLYHTSDGVVDLLKLSPPAMRKYRAEIQMVFQDPYSSLNPRMTVSQIIEEPLRIHTSMTAAARRERAAWLLDKVGLSAEHANRYPHEFSGGQRQRIGIARALATNPRLVIADEPVSALDVSIQAQVINLLQDLQEEFDLSYIFIAHDLSVVRHISDRIAVMYLGQVVELGDSEQVYTDPRHPYTRALLSAVPRPDPDGRRDGRIRLAGDVPDPMNKPSGCAFRTRCPMARPSCAEEGPTLEERDGRAVACPWV